MHDGFEYGQPVYEMNFVVLYCENNVGVFDCTLILACTSILTDYF